MPRITTLLSAALLFVGLAACQATTGDEAPAGETPRDPSPMHYVKISEGPCFGACPIYDFTLRGDGQVTFHGTRFTTTTGQHLAFRSVGTFLDAIETLKAHDFDTLKGVYDRGSEACKMAATDHPTIEVEVRSAEITGSLLWYTGCRGLENRLKLERMVDELKRVMDVEELVGTDADRAEMRRR